MHIPTQEKESEMTIIETAQPVRVDELGWLTVVTDGGPNAGGTNVRVLCHHGKVSEVTEAFRHAEDRLLENDRTWVKAYVIYDGGVAGRGNNEPFSIPANEVIDLVNLVQGVRWM